MRLFLLIAICFSTTFSFAQNDSPLSPYQALDEIPLFPGCSGTKEEALACLNEKVAEHVGQYFDCEMAANLDLPPGSYRMLTKFEVNKRGKVTDVEIRGKHPELINELKRVLKLLPRFKPGELFGARVSVPFALPITINLEAD